MEAMIRTSEEEMWAEIKTELQEMKVIKMEAKQ
jgi:hypothetical protein